MQGNVSITSSDDSLNIIRGNEIAHFTAERELARTSVRYIYTDLCDLQRSYIRLGFHLYEFKVNGYHEDFGYLTFENFCDKNIGMDKGAVSRCINVYLRFAKRHKEGSFVPSMFIDDKYADFSYSQLCEMLPLSEADLKHIRPDMTVKQIREYKKIKDGTFFKVPDKKSCDVATDETRFDMDRFNRCKGIVARNYVKKCVPVGSCPVFLFDTDGKLVDGGFDILFSGREGIVLRKSGEGGR